MSDAKIAREWAEWVNEMPDAHSFAELTAARFILDVDTPPTMADVKWDYNVHAGLCAEHTVRGLVRMVSKSAKLIECIMGNGMLLFSSADKLTPIPGTRLDLTPRLDRCESPEPDIDEDSANAKTDHPEANDPTAAFVPDGKGWLLDGPTGPVVWTSPGGPIMIQRIEPGELTPDQARAFITHILAAVHHSENGCPKPSKEES